jgi:hypothetical protein
MGRCYFGAGLLGLTIFWSGPLASIRWMARVRTGEGRFREVEGEQRQRLVRKG